MPELFKIIEIAVDPRTIAFVMMVLGTALLWTKRDWLGRAMITFVVAVAVLFALLPAGTMLMASLENRFPAPATLPARVHGIIVVGGDFDTALAASRGRYSLGDTALPRLLAAADLARRYPTARVVITGGPPDPGQPEINDAQASSELIQSLGVDAARIILEDRSRNTYENALFSLRVAGAETGQNWILITSAFHMPRAVGSFRRAGWMVIPFPVDYWTGPNVHMISQFSFDGGLRMLAQATREYTALFLYSTFGLTDNILPGPN